VYKDFEEFNRKIHPYWGPGNFTKNSKLLDFLIEYHDKNNEEGEEKCLRKRSLPRKTYTNY